MLTNELNVIIKVVDIQVGLEYASSEYPGDGLYVLLNQHTLLMVLNDVVEYIGPMDVTTLQRSVSSDVAQEVKSVGITEDFVLKAIAVALNPYTLTDAIGTTKLPKVKIDPNETIMDKDD